jgi:hypothetical protein
MAKCIYVWSRRANPISVGELLNKICIRLSPDNIAFNEPVVVVSGSAAYGIINPNSILSERGSSLLLGQIFGEDDNWDVPLRDFPDGSYALFRNGNDYAEIVSDPAASRTIWYYADENVFVASTSQRAIIMFLGNFEFNKNIIPWMLSSGNLGPSNSWDIRIKRVPADSSVILKKADWSVRVKSNPVQIRPVKRSDKEHEKLLKESLENTFGSLRLDYSKWALPLSGGYDSRGILCYLLDKSPDIKNLKTITWGLNSSLEKKGNDAYVARELANRLNVPNKYYTNDFSGEPVDIVINRFVRLGEGRIDNISSYLDGFEMWKRIFEDGIEGIIRGDEGFGCRHYTSELAVRKNQSCVLCSDFANLKDYKKYGFITQELPHYLKHEKAETLGEWCDRIFQEYTLSTEFAALSDLKLSYVEQINPLLSRKILHQVRQLPDHLRAGKNLFKKIVNSTSPGVDYAKDASSSPLSEVLKQKQIVDYMKNELSSDDAGTLFPEEFLSFILKGITIMDKYTMSQAGSFSPRSFIGDLTPRFVREAIRKKVIHYSVDGNILAFRVLLICKTYKVLNTDKSCLYR